MRISRNYGEGIGTWLVSVVLCTEWVTLGCPCRNFFFEQPWSLSLERASRSEAQKVLTGEGITNRAVMNSIF